MKKIQDEREEKLFWQTQISGKARGRGREAKDEREEKERNNQRLQDNDDALNLGGMKMPKAVRLTDTSRRGGRGWIRWATGETRKDNDSRKRSTPRHDLKRRLPIIKLQKGHMLRI